MTAADPGCLVEEAALGRWVGAVVGRLVSQSTDPSGEDHRRLQSEAEPRKGSASTSTSANYLSYHLSSAGLEPKRDRRIQVSEGSRYSRTASCGFRSLRGHPARSYLPKWHRTALTPSPSSQNLEVAGWGGGETWSRDTIPSSGELRHQFSLAEGAKGAGSVAHVHAALTKGSRGTGRSELGGARRAGTVRTPRRSRWSRLGLRCVFYHDLTKAGLFSWFLFFMYAISGFSFFSTWVLHSLLTP